jgi:hypothetical protein
MYTHIISDMGNHDRPKMMAVSEEEGIRIARALSAATHGRWGLIQRNVPPRGRDQYLGCWLDGERQDD